MKSQKLKVERKRKATNYTVGMEDTEFAEKSDPRAQSGVAVPQKRQEEENGEKREKRKKRKKRKKREKKSKRKREGGVSRIA